MATILKRRFIEKIVTNYAYGGLTPHLGIFTTELVSHLNGVSTFRYKIPSSLCHSDLGQEYLSTSATAALFDEFSSLSTILSDRTSRSGVSIVLSAENYQNTPPNSEVLIVSKALKIGKTIGFSEIKMFDSEKTLVASGSHIKFLDAGKVWDVLMSPTLFPFVVNLIDSPFMKQFLLSRGIYYPPPPPLCDANETGSLYPLLGLQSVTPSSYSLTVQPHFTNPNKTFHGGAVAMSAEQVARLSNQGLPHLSFELINFPQSES
jgi:acyl-coenzyme A thioesterase PaaI-like protein